jgi:chemotaxis protein CheX
MSTEFIRPFIYSVVETIEEMIGTGVTLGEPDRSKSTLQPTGVSSMIGLSGDVDAQVCLDVSFDTARSLTSRLNEMNGPPDDKLVQATISEMANTLCGRAASKLVNCGYRLDISPPTVFTGHDPVPSEGLFETVMVPLDSPFGKILLKIIW